MTHKAPTHHAWGPGTHYATKEDYDNGVASPDRIPGTQEGDGKSAPAPVVALPTLVETDGDLSLYSDGSVRSALFDAYLDTYTGPGHVVRHYFFSNTDKVFDLSKAQADNVAYNQANLYGPLGEMAQGLTGMLQGFSASLVDGHFDPHSVKALPYSYASREPVSSIPAILDAWKAAGGYPLAADQAWNVV